MNNEQEEPTLGFFILVMILCMIILSYYDALRRNRNSQYKNIDVVVISKGGNSQVVNRGKFITTDYVKIMLVRMVQDTTLYAELNNRDNQLKLTNELFYSSEIGDTLHYDIIRKERFFKINRK